MRALKIRMKKRIVFAELLVQTSQNLWTSDKHTLTDKEQGTHDKHAQAHTLLRNVTFITEL